MIPLKRKRPEDKDDKKMSKNDKFAADVIPQKKAPQDPSGMMESKKGKKLKKGGGLKAWLAAKTNRTA